MDSSDKATVWIVSFVIFAILALIITIYSVGVWRDVRMAELGYHQTNQYQSMQTGYWVKN